MSADPRGVVDGVIPTGADACFPRFGSVWLCMCGCWNGLWPWCGRCSTFRWNLNGEDSRG